MVSRAYVFERGELIASNSVGAHWPSDVLDLLLAHIFEQIGQLVPDVLPEGSRDTNTIGLGQRFQTRRDVYTVAEDVVLLNDHIAEIDPNSQPDPALFGHVRLTIDHPALDLDRTPDSVHETLKFREQTVTGVLHDAAVVFGYLRINQLAEVRLQPVVYPFLMTPIRREYPATFAARMAARRRVEAMAWTGLSSKFGSVNCSTTRASRYAPDECHGSLNVSWNNAPASPSRQGRLHVGPIHHAAWGVYVRATVAFG
jgi:hypothetical protein